MTIQEAIRNAMCQFADISKSDVFTSKDGMVLAFFFPPGLCLVGVTRWKEGSDYVDIRWRVLIGKISSSFDFEIAMRENHRNPDTPYGLVLLSGVDILTITDTYRFLFSWGMKEIQEIIRLRFGGGLATPFALPGVQLVNQEFFLDAMRKYGLSELLGR